MHHHNHIEDRLTHDRRYLSQFLDRLRGITTAVGKLDTKQDVSQTEPDWFGISYSERSFHTTFSSTRDDTILGQSTGFSFYLAVTIFHCQPKLCFLLQWQLDQRKLLLHLLATIYSLSDFFSEAFSYVRKSEVPCSALATAIALLSSLCNDAKRISFNF